jgi:hypothetical protein
VSISGRGQGDGRRSAYGPDDEHEFKRGHKNAGLRHDESAVGEAGLELNKNRGVAMTVRQQGISAEVRVRPRMESLLDDARTVTQVALRQLLAKVDQGVPLDSEDVKLIRSLVQSTVDLSREERATLASMNLDALTSEELAELLSEATK